MNLSTQQLLELKVGNVSTTIDEDIYEKIKDMYIRVTKSQNGSRDVFRLTIPGTRRTISLHRFIINAPAGKHVDHIDGNHLNNTRANLRVATSSQNQANRIKVTPNKNGLSGVHRYQKRELGFYSTVTRDGKAYQAGSYKTELEAAVSYDLTKIMLFGEYAHTNFDKRIYEVDIDSIRRKLSDKYFEKWRRK